MDFYLILVFKKYFTFIQKIIELDLLFSFFFFFSFFEVYACKYKDFFTILIYYLPPHFTFDLYSLQKKRRRKKGKEWEKKSRNTENDRSNVSIHNSRTMESDIDRFRIESQI